MKLVVLQENLFRSLSIASYALPLKAEALSILNNFFIKTKDGKIQITTSNLETTIKTALSGKVIEEGQVFVPAKILLSILPSLTGEKLTIETEKTLFKIKGTTTTSSLKTEKKEDFPLLSEGGEKEEAELSKKLIEEIKQQVCFAASGDESRTVLTGVLFKVQEQGLNVVATDGFRLSLLTREKEKTLPVGDLILPARTINSLVQIIKEDEEGKVKASFYKDKTQVSFSVSQTKLFTRTIEGKFPDYEKIIPKDYKTRLSVDREEFIRKTKLASVFARETANTVKLKIEKNKLFVLANSPQTGESKGSLEAETKGEETEIAFNFRFLLDFLNSTDAGRVIIETAGSLNPGVFRFEERPDFLHIIMPVRLQES